MSLAGHVLPVTGAAVASNHASRVFVPVRVSWGSSLAAALSFPTSAVAFGVPIDPPVAVLQGLEGAPWFLLSAGATALAAMALLREKGRRARPTWPAAFGAGATARTTLTPPGAIRRAGA